LVTAVPSGPILIPTPTNQFFCSMMEEINEVRLSMFSAMLYVYVPRICLPTLIKNNIIICMSDSRRGFDW
jgi:hypothetical protein